MFFDVLQGLWKKPKTVSIPPDSLEAWRLWMASESLPTLIAGFEIGVFDKLVRGPLTEAELREQLGISSRASKVLFWHLESLQLLNFDSTSNRYALSDCSRTYLIKNSAKDGWKARLRLMTDNAVTPQSYLKQVNKNLPPTLRFKGTDKREAPLLKIAQDRFALPTVITACELGLVALIGERKVDAETAAETTEISLRYVNEMLAALREYGLANERSGKWGLSESGKTYLLDGELSPYNWQGLFTLMTENPPTPKSLLEAIAKEKASPTPDSDAMMEHVMSAALALTFARHMHSQGAAAAVAVAQHPFLDKTTRLLDVAGGGGTYSLEMAKQRPNLQFSVMELSPMVQITKQWIKFHRVQRTVSALEGNMFLASDWPKDKFDTIFFSHVMHDWGTAKIKLLMQNAFAALPSGGQVVLHEVLVGRGGDPRLIATAFSATLYKWTEGRQYKAAELMDLLRSVGFEVSMDDISPAHGPSSLIVARKPVFKINV